MYSAWGVVHKGFTVRAGKPHPLVTGILTKQPEALQAARGASFFSGSKRGAAEAARRKRVASRG